MITYQYLEQRDKRKNTTTAIYMCEMHVLGLRNIN